MLNVFDQNPIQACTAFEDLISKVTLPTSGSKLDPESEKIVDFIQRDVLLMMLSRIFGPIEDNLTSFHFQRSWMFQSHASSPMADALFKLLRPDGKLFSIMAFLSQSEYEKPNMASHHFCIPIEQLPVSLADSLRKPDPENRHVLLRMGVWQRKAEAPDTLHLNMFSFYMILFARYALARYAYASTLVRSSVNDALNEDDPLGAFFTSIYDGICLGWNLLLPGSKPSDESNPTAAEVSALEKKRQAREITRLQNKAARTPRLAPEPCFVKLLKSYLDTFYKGFPDSSISAATWAYPQMALHAQQAQAILQAQYQGTVLLETLIELWGGHPNPSPATPQVFLQRCCAYYSIPDVLIELVAADRVHWEKRYLNPTPLATHGMLVGAAGGGGGGMGPRFGGSANYVQLGAQPRIPRFCSLEDLHIDLYCGILHYLVNVLRTGTSLSGSQIPIDQIVQLWIRYCTPFDLNDTTGGTKNMPWPWTHFVMEHYEMYSVVLIDFIKHSLKTGLLFSVYFGKDNTGPKIFLQVLKTFLHPPLNGLLRQINAELVQYHNHWENRQLLQSGNTFSSGFHDTKPGAGKTIEILTHHQYIGGRLSQHTLSSGITNTTTAPATSLAGMSHGFGNVGTSGGGHTLHRCGHIPIFTQENADRAMQLLDAAWECCPIDFRKDLTIVSVELGNLFGFQYVPATESTQPTATSASSSSISSAIQPPTSSLTSIPPSSTAMKSSTTTTTTTRRQPMAAFASPAITVDQKRELWENQRHYRHQMGRVPILGDPDNLPIQPNEIEFLVDFLLKYQELICRVLHSFSFGFLPLKLRLRPLASYPVLITILCCLWVIRLLWSWWP